MAQSNILDEERLLAEQYYTDGSRLYRIVQVNDDWTVVVENCSTLYTHMISIDTVYDGWTEVNLHELCA